MTWLACYCNALERTELWCWNTTCRVLQLAVPILESEGVTRHLPVWWLFIWCTAIRSFSHMNNRQSRHALGGARDQNRTWLSRRGALLEFINFELPNRHFWITSKSYSFVHRLRQCVVLFDFIWEVIMFLGSGLGLDAKHPESHMIRISTIIGTI